MKKFTPSILIYQVSLTDKETSIHYQDFYFLSYRRTVKFVEKNADKIKDMDVNVGIGGEQLWFW